jgi:hypothetical protein
MKKLILGTIACAFLVSPALASDFAADQAKELGKIIAKMDTVKNDPVKMDFITKKRNCVEKATNVEDLQKCIAEFPAEKKDATAK